MGGSPVHAPPQHEPLAHRVPFVSGVGALHKPLAGTQVRGAWQLVDGHVTLPAAQRSVGREGGQGGRAAGLTGEPMIDGGAVRGKTARR
jgi:hypothetical protein